MAETVEPAAEPAPALTPVSVAPAAPTRPRMPAAFARALAGAALLVGTVVTIVIVVAATTTG